MYLILIFIEVKTIFLRVNLYLVTLLNYILCRLYEAIEFIIEMSNIYFQIIYCK